MRAFDSVYCCGFWHGTLSVPIHCMASDALIFYRLPEVGGGGADRGSDQPPPLPPFAQCQCPFAIIQCPRIVCALFPCDCRKSGGGADRGSDQPPPLLSGSRGTWGRSAGTRSWWTSCTTTCPPRRTSPTSRSTSSAPSPSDRPNPTSSCPRPPPAYPPPPLATDDMPHTSPPTPVAPRCPPPPLSKSFS